LARISRLDPEVGPADEHRAHEVRGRDHDADRHWTRGGLVIARRQGIAIGEKAADRYQA